MIISYQLSTLISGIISGMILFQTSIVAPSVFKTLDADSAGPFLRSIFPKLFFIILVLGFVSLLQAVVFNSSGSNYISQIVVPFLTIVSMAICFFIVPATNRSRDSGNDFMFNWLHRLSVFLTVTVLIVNLGWIFIDKGI